MSMKKLQCRVLCGDNFTNRLKGLLVTVVAIDRTCFSGGFMVTVMIDDDVPPDIMSSTFSGLNWKKGSEVKMFSDELEPVDVETIPETHRKSPVLRQAWAFCEARNDAWYRNEPKDKAAYRDQNDGKDLVDKRVYDVAQRSY
jgi:hypothetical protein